MNNCIITIKSPTHSLADIYECLKELQSGLVRQFSQEFLSHITAINPQFNAPTHIAQKVYLKQRDKEEDTPIYMLYSNLGSIIYSEGEILDNFLISDVNCYFNYQIKDANDPNKWISIENRQYLAFDRFSKTEWKAEFDFEEIFHFFSLDGSDDAAPFVCFVVLHS